MGAIIKRGTKQKPRFYLRFIDTDGTRRMVAAKGATRREDARAQLNAIERRIFEGVVGVPQPAPADPAAEQRRTVTIRELGDLFVEKFTGPRIKDPEDYRMEAKSVLTVRVYPTLADYSAASVTSLDVEALRDKLAEDYAPATVNNTLNTLSKLYGWATKQKLIDCPNPVRGVERPRADDSEPIDATKYLSRDEAAALLEYAERWGGCFVLEPTAREIYPMIATALYAGLRKGELYGLRWTDLDFDRGQITVAKSYDGKTKSGKTRHVPLVARLAPVLRAWRDRPGRDASGLVFPIQGRMGQAYETRGLGAMMLAAFGREPPKVWHSLRHSYASHFVMVGGSILSLQKLLGHADIATTMVYAHLSPDHLAAEAARLDFASRVPANVTPISSAQSA